MKVLYLPLGILLTLLLTQADAPPAFASGATLDDCNSSYHSSDFNQAIVCYQQLVPDDYSAAVLYNIANSYAQLKKPGYAILYYLRALALTPDDPDIRGNLALVRDAYGLFAPASSIGQLVVNLLTRSQWAMLSLLALLSYLVYASSRLKKRGGYMGEAVVIAVCLLVFGAGVFGATMRHKQLDQAVVVIDAKMLLSPYEGASSIGSIKAGRLIHPEKQHGFYWYVTDETGREGWLAKETFKKILPD